MKNQKKKKKRKKKKIIRIMDVVYSNGYYYLFNFDKGIYRYKEGSKEGMKFVRQLKSFSLIGRVIRFDVDSADTLLLNDNCQNIVCCDTVSRQEVVISGLQVPGTDQSAPKEEIWDHQAAPRSRVVILKSEGIIFCYEYKIQKRKKRKKKDPSRVTLLSTYKAITGSFSPRWSTLSVCEKGKIVSIHLDYGREAVAQYFFALRPRSFEQQLRIDVKKKGIQHFFQGTSFHSYVRTDVVIFSGIELADQYLSTSKILMIFYQTKSKKVLTSRVFEGFETTNCCVLRLVKGTLSLIGVGCEGVPFKVL